MRTHIHFYFFSIMFFCVFFFAQIGVVSVERGTVVDIRFPPGVSVFYEGITYSHTNRLTATLDDVRVFVVSHADDLTGTQLTSRNGKPIAVFAGRRWVQHRFFCILLSANCVAFFFAFFLINLLLWMIYVTTNSRGPFPQARMFTELRNKHNISTRNNESDGTTIYTYTLYVHKYICISL